MEGNNIQRRPPILNYSSECKRFCKVNPNGSDAIVKIKFEEYAESCRENYQLDLPIDKPRIERKQ